MISWSVLPAALGMCRKMSGAGAMRDFDAAGAAFETFAGVAVFSMQVAGAIQRLAAEFGIDVVEAPDTGALAWFALNARRTGALWRDGGGPAFVTCVHSPTEWISQWNRTP